MGKITFGNSPKLVEVKIPAEQKEKMDYVVKNIDVVIALINTVAQKELEIFSKEKPCIYRSVGDEIMTCKCALKLDGEEVKTFEQCRQCKFIREK